MRPVASPIHAREGDLPLDRELADGSCRGRSHARPRLDAELRAALLAPPRRIAGWPATTLEDPAGDYVPDRADRRILPVAGFPAGATSRSGLLRALSSGRRWPAVARAFSIPTTSPSATALYVSQLYAAIMAVPGVESAQITRLARRTRRSRMRDTATNLAKGFLQVAPTRSCAWTTTATPRRTAR